MTVAAVQRTDLLYRRTLDTALTAASHHYPESLTKRWPGRQIEKSTMATTGTDCSLAEMVFASRKA